jgi:hypothetical protein
MRLGISFHAIRPPSPIPWWPASEARHRRRRRQETHSSFHARRSDSSLTPGCGRDFSSLPRRLQNLPSLHGCMPVTEFIFSFICVVSGVRPGCFPSGKTTQLICRMWRCVPGGFSNRTPWIADCGALPWPMTATHRSGHASYPGGMPAINPGVARGMSATPGLMPFHS